MTGLSSLPAAQAATVPALLARRVALSPDAVAYCQQAGGGAWQPVRWSAFAAQVSHARQALAAAGMRRGDRLALIAPVSLRWEVLHHAAMGLGVVVVGLDAHDLPARLGRMLEQAGITAVAASDPTTLSAATPATLSRCKLLLLLADEAPPSAAGWLAWPAFQAQAAEAPEAALQPPAGSDLATIIFTSGTTGTPKGIAYTHAQVCQAAAAIGEAFPFADAGSRLLCWLPLSNLFQRIVNLAAMRQGPATYLLDDPRRVMEVVAQVAPDIFIGVPRFYEKLHAGLLESLARQPAPVRWLVRWAWQTGRRLRACQREGRPVPASLAAIHRLADRLVLRRLRALMGDRLQCMVSGSAPMPLSLLHELHALGWLVLESYGTSENIVPITINRLDAFRLGTVGRVVPGNEIRIDATGMIEVRGPGVFSGYLGGADDAAPASGLGDSGWYTTGDLGLLDADGYLTLTGREGDIFKTSTGRRVAPAAVEAVLRAIPGVDNAVLLGAGQKCTVAICACPGGPHATRLGGEALRALLRDHMQAVNPHERPGAVALLDTSFSIESGEMTPNLKLRRSAIASRHADVVQALYAAVDTGHSPRADVVVLA